MTVMRSVATPADPKGLRARPCAASAAALGRAAPGEVVDQAVPGVAFVAVPEMAAASWTRSVPGRPTTPSQ